MAKLVQTIILWAQDPGHWREKDPLGLPGERQGAHDTFPVKSGARLPLGPRETPEAQGEALPQVTGQLGRGTLLTLLGSPWGLVGISRSLTKGKEKNYQNLPLPPLYHAPSQPSLGRSRPPGQQGPRTGT